MKTIFEHINTVKAKPHHIRKGIAFFAATVGAGLIALVWLASSLATGAFAVQGSSFADATGHGSVEVTSATDNSTQNLAGAAAAIKAESAPAHIEIIDTTPAKTPVKTGEQTTIPF